MASTRYYSNYSSIVSVKTNENKIATPTVSSFTYDETKGFTVKYKSNTTSFTGFEVKILDKNNNQVCYKQTDTKTTSVTLNSSNIKANTKYTVQVKAFNTVNGTKKYSSYASKDLTTPKQAVIKEGDRPSVKDVTYHENCTYTDGSGDDGNGNLYYIFVGYSREFELSDENGKALSTSNTKVTVTENGTDKTSELVKITNTSKGISIEPKKATSGKVTIKFARTDRNVSVSYQYKFVQIADIPSSIDIRSRGNSDGSENPTNELDSNRYVLSQIKEKYSIWLNGKEGGDSLFNKLLYSYEVTTRSANYCDYGTDGTINRAFLYGALVNHKSSCDGNVVAFDSIAKMIGFPSEYLSEGHYDNTTGIHSYNMVTVDGKKWYKVDCDSDRYFDHQNGTPSYGSFMKGYYGFACSSQEEYDNAVAKVKTEFKNAINEIGKVNDYSIAAVDEKLDGMRIITYIAISPSSNKTIDGLSVKEIVKDELSFADTINGDSDLYINDYSTTYAENKYNYWDTRGYIKYAIYASASTAVAYSDESEIPVIVIDDDTCSIENNTNEAEPTITAEPKATPSVEPSATPEPTFEPTENSEVTEDTEETTISSETDETSEIEIEAETSSETELTDESLTEESN